MFTKLADTSNSSDSFDSAEYESIEQLKKRIRFLESELHELNDYVTVEKLASEDHRHLEVNLQQANEMNDDLMERNQLLEELLAEKQRTIDENLADVRTKQACDERDKALKLKSAAESQLAGVEMEYDSYKTKMKKRETDLIAALDEARGDRSEQPATVEVDSAELESLKSTIKSLQDELTASNDERQKLAITHKELTQNYDETSNQLMEQIEQNEELQAKYETLNQLSSFETIISKFSDDCDFDSFECESVNVQVKNFINILKTCQQNAKDLKESQLKNIELSSTVDDLNYKLEQLALAVETKSNEVKQLENSMSEQEAIMSSEIAELKKGLTELMGLGEENSRLTTRIADLKSHNANQKKNIDELAKGLILKENEIKNLIAENGKSQCSQAKSNDELVESLKSKLEEMEKTLSAEFAVKQTLQESIQLTLKECDDKIIELEALHRDELKTFTDDLANKLSTANQEIEMLTGQCSTLQKELDALENIQLTNDELRSKVEELEAMKQTWADERLDFENKLEAMKGLLSLREADVERLNMLLKENETKTESLQQTNQVRLLYEIDLFLLITKFIFIQSNDHQEQLEIVKQTNHELSLKLQSFEVTQHELLELENNFAELQATLSMKESQLSSLEQIVEEKDREIGKLTSQKIAQISIDQETQVDEESYLEKERDDLKHQLDTAWNEIEAFTAENSSLKEHISSLESMQFVHEELVQKSDAMTKELANLRVTLNEKESEITNLNEALQKKVDEIENMQTNQKTEQTPIDQQTQVDLDDVEKERDDLKRKLDDVQCEIETLSEQVSDLEKQLQTFAELQLSHAELLQKSETKSQELSELQCKITELQTSLDLKEKQIQSVKSELRVKEQLENLHNYEKVTADHNTQADNDEVSILNIIF